MTEAAIQGETTLSVAVTDSVSCLMAHWGCCQLHQQQVIFFPCVFLKVKSATKATLTELMDEIIICGYNGPVTVDKREEIVWQKSFCSLC